MYGKNSNRPRGKLLLDFGLLTFIVTILGFTVIIFAVSVKEREYHTALIAGGALVLIAFTTGKAIFAFWEYLTVSTTFRSHAATPAKPLTYDALTIEIRRIVPKGQSAMADLSLRAGDEVSLISGVSPRRLLAIGKYRILVIDIVAQGDGGTAYFVITGNGNPET